MQANKESLGKVVALAQAHRELPRRNKLVSAFLRQLPNLVERFGLPEVSTQKHAY